jgi:hypothetical protein
MKGMKMKPEENDEVDELIPPDFYLSQNYPNPFKDRTVIKYCVPYKLKVRITVYTPAGEIVTILKDEIHEPGTYEVVFQSAVFSQQSSSEEYFYRLEAGDYKCEKKMSVMK